MVRLFSIAALLLAACGPEHLDSTERDWDTICEAQCLCETDVAECVASCHRSLHTRECAVAVANCVIDAESDGTCEAQTITDGCWGTICECIGSEEACE